MLCLVGVVLLAAVALASGVIPQPGARGPARPPCEQLPTKATVTDAIVSHEDVVARIENIGPGVRVYAATPCQGRPDRAILSIEYATESERNGVDAILQQQAFGVPVQLVSG